MNTLRRLGIDPPRYRLLVELFTELSLRNEMLGQLGANGIALRGVAWLYGGITAFFALVLAATRSPLAAYSSVTLFLATFLLFNLLLAEAGNSLVNPQEGLVLAHQPVNGATYTAAKLTHLLRILAFLTPATSAAPALLGLAAPGAPLYYPLLHAAAAAALAVFSALAACAIFGWFIRVLPLSRIQAAGQLAEILPLLFVNLMQFAPRRIPEWRLFTWLAARPGLRLALLATLAAAALIVLVQGLRALSADYLIRVAGIARGRSTRRNRPRASLAAGIVARHLGGPAARAGYEFTARLMWRDWQARRRLLPLVLLAFVFVPQLVRQTPANPFSASFSPLQVFPHILGVLTLLLCQGLSYGNDYKAAWIFMPAPASAFRGFAGGVFAVHWIKAVALPHALFAPWLAWHWGADAALFLAFSLAIASTWLAIALRFIEGLPFCSQFDPASGAALMPIMLVSAILISIAAAVQHFVLFRSRVLVAVVALLAAATAWAVTRKSLHALAGAFRFHASQLTRESGGLYTEIGF